MVLFFDRGFWEVRGEEVRWLGLDDTAFWLQIDNWIEDRHAERCTYEIP